MVRILMAIKIAQRALGRNLMRSSLTMLGVIIGVGAVIAMVAIGQGAHASIRAKIASLGANSLIVLPGSTTQGGVRYGWGGRATLRAAGVPASTWRRAYVICSSVKGDFVMQASAAWGDRKLSLVLTLQINQHLG